jgi:lipooligosaccharide transport system ATP-binding protein
MQYIIEARNLTKRFGELVAVDNVSFDILPGECYGILGPNGAGKTTTIRMIYGFSPVTAGELTVFGMDLRKHLRAIKSRIGVCQQENNLDPDLNLLQNLEVFGLFFDLTRRQAREKAETLLAFMALDHRKEAKALELSGGMTRRMVLARALINDPELLILDEPTTGLDPQSRHQVWERLEDLKKRGITVLLTTHYMDEASRLCDRLMIMDHGRILVQGKPVDLIRQYVGQDVIEVAEPDEALRAYIKSRQLQHEDFGHRMVIYEGNGGNLYQEISKHYCQEGCILRMATLEDVFLKLTGRELRE